MPRMPKNANPKSRISAGFAGAWCNIAKIAKFFAGLLFLAQFWVIFIVCDACVSCVGPWGVFNHRAHREHRGTEANSGV